MEYVSDNLSGLGRGDILFIIDFLKLNLGAYLIYWANNTVEYVSGPFRAEVGAYEIGKKWIGFGWFGLG